MFVRLKISCFLRNCVISVVFKQTKCEILESFIESNSVEWCLV